MFIKNTQIKNFRNLYTSNIEFNDGVNIFLGENAQGKTNLLESLFISCSGNSFRTLKNEHLVNNPEDKSNNLEIQCQIKTIFVDENLDYEMEFSSNGKFKKLQLNHKKFTPKRLHQKFGCLLFSPESLNSIKGGPEQRRKLIDELILIKSSENEQTIIDFNKLLKSKNRALKDHIKGQLSKKQIMDLLESLNQVYLDKAVDYTYLRLNSFADIQDDLNKILVEITDIEESSLEIKYLISDQVINSYSKDQIFDHLQKQLDMRKEAELASGLSLVGPHKHDISFIHNGRDSRFFSSQGQQRALILAYKMAQIVYHKRLRGSYPILMLDDVLSELDSKRRSHLIDFLRSSESQTFITTTDFDIPKKLEGLRPRVFEINGGMVQKISD